MSSLVSQGDYLDKVSVMACNGSVSSGCSNQRVIIIPQRKRSQSDFMQREPAFPYEKSKETQHDADSVIRINYMYWRKLVMNIK